MLYSIANISIEFVSLFSDKLIFWLLDLFNKQNKSIKSGKKSKKPIEKMGKQNSDPAIWFDGVDKKLLQAHTSKPSTLEGDTNNLVTHKPLATLSYYSRLTIKNKKPDEKNDVKKRQLDTASEDTDGSNKKIKITNNQCAKSNSKTNLNSKDTIKPHMGVTEELAIDCEMVECYYNTSVLARVSIVNLFGHPILDKYVAPPDKVTDYRTRYSGIRRRDLVNAHDFETVQKEVANLIEGRIVIGHAIHNDFSVLRLSHPPERTRDTSKYFRYLFQGKTPSLKKLCETLLGVKIQKGEHNSVQDAQATMKLYVLERDKWNSLILKGDFHSTTTHPPNHSRSKQKANKQKPKKKKVKTFWVQS